MTIIRFINRSPVQVPINTLSSFVSIITFKICLVIEVSSSSMDIPTKGIVNFWGLRGSGKTTFIENHLKMHIKLDHDILKTKDKTVDFFGRMRYSKLPLILDDFELVESLIGTKEFDTIKLKVPFYVVSNSKIAQSWVTDFYEFKGVDPLEFAKSVGLSVKEAVEKLKKSNGNMTSVKIDTLDFMSVRDEISTPKAYVTKLLTTDEPLINSMNRIMMEHGNTLGIIHENYPDYTSDCETLSKIAESFSDADFIDGVIYKDVSWELIQYFNISACLIPSLLLKKNRTPVKNPVRTGSIWTKYSNGCMKANRLKRLRINRDCLNLLISYMNLGEGSFQFDSYDLDSINQLSLSEKIKPKILSKMKSLLKK